MVAVTANRKIGGPVLTVTEPLLLLTRDLADGFSICLDNTARYADR